MFITYMEIPRTEQTPAQLSFENILSGNLPTMPIYSKTNPRTINIPNDKITDETNIAIAGKLSTFYRLTAATITNYSNIEMSTLYHHFTIPKASGGERPIDAPNEYLKNDLTKVRLALSSMGILAHTSAYAYVPRRCAKDAIERHQKTEHKYYLKLDLHNFFGSCTEQFIKDQLTQIAYFAQMSPEFLNDFLHMAMLNGSLPQGSPLSPWLTNQIMLPFDFKMANWCSKQHITYTRYADDMLFSANFDIRNTVQTKVAELLEGTPLTLNTEKTHQTTISGRNWNLGIMTNKDNHMTVGYKKKEIMRARLTEFCKEKDSWNTQQAQELLGNLTYLSSIEPEYFQNLLTKYGNKFNVDIHSELIRIIRTQQ